MSDNNINILIVDLRKNSGGNSYLAYILAYFLYGSKILDIDTGYDIEGIHHCIKGNIVKERMKEHLMDITLMKCINSVQEREELIKMAGMIQLTYHKLLHIMRETSALLKE